MADAIVKFQHRLPFPKAEILEVIEIALKGFIASGGQVEPPHTVTAADYHTDARMLEITLSGPAGAEVFRIKAEDVQDVEEYLGDCEEDAICPDCGTDLDDEGCCPDCG